MSTRQLHVNDANFSAEDKELLDFLAKRRQLALVTELAIKRMLDSELPIIKDAKEALDREHAQKATT